MADKVKPLKIENSATGGTQNDPFPTEANPTQDYLATKGIAYENLDTFRTEKLGRSIVNFFPNTYENITFSGNAPSNIEYFNNASFITANRIARRDFTYTNNKLTSETLNIYDTDGSTILRTYTYTYNYSGNSMTSSNVVIT